MTAALSTASPIPGYRPMDYANILKLGEPDSLTEVTRLRQLIRRALSQLPESCLNRSTARVITEIIDHYAYSFNVQAHVGACRAVGVDPYPEVNQAQAETAV